MNLAKPAELKNPREPNALSTFVRYLLDYASPATRQAGQKRVAAAFAEKHDRQRRTSEKLLAQARSGKQDVFDLCHRRFAGAGAVEMPVPQR
jgi:2-iminoacetate synthase